jgi:hypothetical protein
MNQTYLRQKFILNLFYIQIKGKIYQEVGKMEKETIAKILAYVEKNCAEVEEVEEYLWKLLDGYIEK